MALSNKQAEICLFLSCVLERAKQRHILLFQADCPHLHVRGFHQCLEKKIKLVGLAADSLQKLCAFLFRNRFFQQRLRHHFQVAHWSFYLV